MRFIVGVFGKAGSGKSCLIYDLLDSVPAPVFILDTQDEFNIGLVFYSGAELLDYLRAGGENASGFYVLKTTNDVDFDLFFEILTASKTPATIVIDEADLFCTPYNINENLSLIIKYGRHWEQNILYAARRPAEVNRNLTAQSDCLVSFKQTEPRDLAALKKSYAAAEGLADLDETQFEFLVLGRSEHLPFSAVLESRANTFNEGLTKTVPEPIIESETEEPESPASPIEENPSTEETETEK